MKIAAVNGSPKTSGISALIIHQMEQLLGQQMEKYQAIQVIQAKTQEETISQMLESDILLFVFPLFIDSLPAPLIELLTRLERAASHGRAIPQVFVVVNGALNAPQTALALKMMEHFTHRAGLPWGYGIGIGAGSMLYHGGVSWEKGIASGVHRTLSDLAAAIKEKNSGPNLYISPKFPLFLYKAIGNFHFRFEAKRNGVRNLWRQPYSGN